MNTTLMIHNLCVIVDWVIFAYFALSVMYLAFYAFSSLVKRKPSKKQCGENLAKKNRFLVLFPAYKEDSVIELSVLEAIKQDYPTDLYEIAVISDKMQPETNERLEKLPITLVKVNFENSTKAKSLMFTASKYDIDQFDVVVILDADNIIKPDFLKEINNAYNRGSRAIQAHRVASNYNTEVAILDAISEEINNSIFRKGHVNMGISSALIGSGMAFDYKWFKNNINVVTSVGEDKEFEILLLKQRIFIDYLEDVYVYDLKSAQKQQFYNQRRRWIYTQFMSLNRSGRDIFQAIKHRNFAYLDKIFQWQILPRILILGLLSIISLMLIIIHPILVIKWIVLLLIFIVALYVSIPEYLMKNHFKQAVKEIPSLFGLMFLNLFRLRGVSKKFIHTPKDNVRK